MERRNSLLYVRDCMMRWLESWESEERATAWERPSAIRATMSSWMMRKEQVAFKSFKSEDLFFFLDFNVNLYHPTASSALSLSPFPILQFDCDVHFGKCLWRVVTPRLCEPSYAKERVSDQRRDDMEWWAKMMMRLMLPWMTEALESRSRIRIGSQLE